MQFIDTLKRWVNNKFQRNYEWLFSSDYWKFLRTKEKAVFLIKKGTFNTKKNIIERYESYNIFIEIIKIIFPSLFISFISIISIGIIEKYLIENNILIIQLIEKNTLLLGIFNFLKNIYYNFNASKTLSYIGILASISGVFLGLYFTAISLVLSTVYEQVTEDVRKILTEEKIGNIYINTVTILCCDCIVVLFLDMFNFYIGLVNILIITLLGIFSILSFIILGKRILTFFNPVNLTTIISKDLIKNFNLVSPKGSLEWNNKSIQKYAQIKAEKILTTYRDIIKVSLEKESAKYELLENISSIEISLAGEYSTYKSYIPSKSEWFKRNYVNKDWFIADYPSIDLAIKTRTFLAPESQPDYLWFEKIVSQDISLISNNLISSKEYIRLTLIYENINNCIKITAYYYLIDEAISYLDTMYLLIINNIKDLNFENNIIKNTDKIKYIINIVDYIELYYIDILVSLTDNIEKMSLNNLDDYIDVTFYNNNEKMLYTIKFPRPVLSKIEEIRENISIEKDVEGNIITTKWYIKQIIIKEYIVYLKYYFETYVKSLTENINEYIKLFINSQMYLAATQTCLRRLEICEKYHFHKKIIIEKLNEFNKANVNQEEWITIPWEEHDKKIIELKQLLIKNLMYLINKLIDIQITNELPDYYGHVHSLLLEECYEALLNNDKDRLRLIFPSILVSCFSASDKIKNKLKGYNTETIISLSTDPIIDLLSLSGYACIYSEIHKNSDLEKITFDTWDLIFNSKNDNVEKQQLFNYLVLSVKKIYSFYITPRDIIRTEWSQKLRECMKERKLITDYDYGYHRARKIKTEKTTIIDLVGGIWETRYKAEYIFIAKYMNKYKWLDDSLFSEDIMDLNKILDNKEG